MRILARIGAALASVVLTLTPAFANKALEGIACRSVHLGYPGAPGATLFYNEVTPLLSKPGTYFCAIGWNAGYYGFQELGNGKKLVIFSVWDSNATNDRNAVAEEKRVKLIYKDECVRTGRFGGEGTGGQSFFDCDWKIGEPMRFAVAGRPSGADRTEYTGFLYIAETKSWKRLITFSCPRPYKPLGGLYSFIEDFKRDRESTRHTRRATFGPAFALADDGLWKLQTEAKFTGDSNPSMNVDSGLADSARFFLATGGDITNATTPIFKSTKLTVTPALPEDLDALAKTVAALPKSEPAKPAEKPAETPAAK